MKIITHLILDVDGTLTDGKIYIGENGEVMKAFNAKDGYAIREILPKYGITPIIITGRESKIVANRANELGIKFIFQGVRDKATFLKKFIIDNLLTFEQIAYVGDDMNDYEAMNLCGFKACPSDAVSEVQNICDYVSLYNGGCGAARDVCEYIVKQNGT